MNTDPTTIDLDADPSPGTGAPGHRPGAPWIRRRARLVRPLAVATVAGALLFVSVATAVARHDRTLHLIAHTTSFAADQKDPATLAPGDEIFIGGTLARFDHPSVVVGTYGIWCAVVGLGGSRLQCHGANILPEGQIIWEILLVQPEELHRHAAITGGTGAYVGASGEAIGTTIDEDDEDGVFILR